MYLNNISNEQKSLVWKLKLAIFLIISVSLISTFIMPGIANACTGVYVGKDVSADGQAIIARSVDAHPLDTLICPTYNPRVENQEGRIYKAVDNNFEYPLPSTTYRYLSMPQDLSSGGALYGEACSNEYGVVVSATVTCYTSPEILKIDPFTEDGFSEEVCSDILCMCSKTAREAVELCGKIIDTYGSNNANSLICADQSEAWLIELYSGHQWAAIKLPTDKVSVYGNQFMIQAEYEKDNTNNFLCSKDLFSLPTKAGLTVMKDGKMSLCETYSGKDRLWDYANLRTYMGHYFLNPDTAGTYNTFKRYDLFFNPKEKVKIQDVFETFRYRYEGTQYNPEETNRDDIRVIGTEAQNAVHAIQINEDAPAEISDTTWCSLAPSEFSIFLPYSNLLSKFFLYYNDSSTWSDNSIEEIENDEGEALWNDLDSASAAYKFLNSICVIDRNLYGQNVRKFWKEKENDIINEYSHIYQHALSLYQTDPSGAQEYLNNWSHQLQKETLAECLSMCDELKRYIIEVNETFKHSYHYDTLTVDSATQNDKAYQPKMLLFDKYMDDLSKAENSVAIYVNKTAAIVACAVVAVIVVGLVIFLILRRKHR